MVTLDLSENKELRSGRALAGIVRELSGLKELNLGWCGGLTSLPAEVGELKSLVTLDLYGCDGLMEMPDLSALRGLEVKYYPQGEAYELGKQPNGDFLKAWEAGGRKAYAAPARR